MKLNWTCSSTCCFYFKHPRSSCFFSPLSLFLSFLFFVFTSKAHGAVCSLSNESDLVISPPFALVSVVPHMFHGSQADDLWHLDGLWWESPCVKEMSQVLFTVFSRFLCWVLKVQFARTLVVEVTAKHLFKHFHISSLSHALAVGSPFGNFRLLKFQQRSNSFNVKSLPVL